VDRAEYIEELESAIDELLEVAELRGDDDLPHPSNDPLLWSARMQSAWDRLQKLREPGEEEGS